ncbi:competence protein ComEC [Zobellia uliginosa]|uniref:Competence protein ComEC n=1 Tax=Zobellia uliginosa TaxID=143224 RepID=A0ABY1KJL6_9FLAO|nr:ComEC/Rec2 family competence protein [Zobellia uliginosa]SIS42048.1 competence protein ComEC [Zobellia uliginosa]
MKLLRFIPIKLTLVLILGIIVGNYLQLPVPYPMTTCLGLLVALGILRFNDKWNESHLFGYLAVLTTLSIGVFATSLARPENQANHYLNHDFKGNHTWHIKISRVLKPTSFSDRYIGEIRGFDQQRARGKILLNLIPDSTLQKFQVDDELLWYGSIAKTREALNPHQFNYKAYLNGLGISHQIQMTPKTFIPLENASSSLYGLAAKTRNHIISQLRKARFGKDELSIIQALLLGQRNDISEETYTDYKNAGAVHILAVSGLHIGILLLLLQFLLRPLERLPKGKGIKLALTVILLWGFAFLSGLSASVVRAVTMFSFLAYSMYLNRPNNTFNILALSMFFILLAIDPNLLFQVGFQMSYTAVLAIVWFYPRLQKLWLPKNLVVRKAWELLSVSIAAQLGVLPIGLFYFHQFPALFFISNLLIVPALGALLGIGILIILLALADIYPDLLISAYDTLIGYMNSIIAWVAQQETFVFKNIPFDGVQMVLAYAGLLCLALLIVRPNFKKVLALAMTVIAFQLWLLYCHYHASEKNVLLLVHQTKNTAFFLQTGKELRAISSDTARLGSIIRDYSLAERISDISYPNLKNSYVWKDKKLLVIDSLAVYPEDNRQVDYLILTQSPKLNLERVIAKLEPQCIIADGSNYKSYIDRWKQTCLKRKLPFHATGEKGAYYFY